MIFEQNAISNQITNIFCVLFSEVTAESDSSIQFQRTKKSNDKIILEHFEAKPTKVHLMLSNEVNL